MKPAPFEYFAPESVQEALSLLEQHGDVGKILAGGQSPGPHLNMRIISPEVIIDINPAAELPAVVIALDAELRILGPEGERTVHPKDFFVTHMTADLKPDELLVEARFPPARPRTGHAWFEIARRHGDYALVGVGAVLTLSESGVCDAARLAYTGVEAVPFGAQEAADLLVG